VSAGFAASAPASRESGIPSPSESSSWKLGMSSRSASSRPSTTHSPWIDSEYRGRAWLAGWATLPGPETGAQTAPCQALLRRGWPSGRCVGSAQRIRATSRRTGSCTRRAAFATPMTRDATGERNESSEVGQAVPTDRYAFIGPGTFGSTSTRRRPVGVFVARTSAEDPSRAPGREWSATRLHATPTGGGALQHQRSCGGLSTAHGRCQALDPRR